MTRTVRFTILLALVVCGSALAADAPEKDAPRDDPPAIDWKKAEGKVSDAGLTGEYLELARVIDATPEQEKQLKADQDERQEALAKWDEEHKETLERAEKAIRSARNDAQKERYEKARDRLLEDRTELAERHLQKSVKRLKPEQQKAFQGHRLWKAVDAQFQELGVKLEGEQYDKAQEICIKLAKRFRGSNPAESTRLKKAAFNEVGKDVLTREQKQTVAIAYEAARQRAEARRKAAEEREEEEDEDDDDRRREKRGR
jgi:Spy/CpxP family protein refolding chaperone